jgi:cytochrome c peroxidase
VRRAGLLGGAAVAVAAVLAFAVLRPGGETTWSPAELETLRSLSLASLGDPPAEPSNRVAGRRDAARLGRSLFFETRLSANGQVSCATCHQPARGFQDGRALGRGLGTTTRRTMTVVGAAWQRWLFWDGRKDSLWSQALAPLEDGAEHGLTRTEVVRTVADVYGREYERVFGPLPRLARMPERASPIGNAAARRAWGLMRPRDQRAVDRAFANVGKAIAAYERRLRPAAARFDDYVASALRGDGERMGTMLSERELAGLRLFLGDAHCIDCHSGPLFTNGEFHNTGVRPNRGDVGRAAGLDALRADAFNCLGRYADGDRDDCALRFAPTLAPAGTFKPPSLRNVTRRAPYMHAGQIATLADVLRHYDRAPPAQIGRTELDPLGLSADQLESLRAFLRTLESR